MMTAPASPRFAHPSIRERIARAMRASLVAGAPDKALTDALTEAETELANIVRAIGHRLDAGAVGADAMILARVRRAARRAIAAADAYERRSK